MVVVVSVDIPAPREEVWRHLSDLASHGEWMADAESVEILPGPPEGEGAHLRVQTRVGPLRTVDDLVVTEWAEGRLIGVRHLGSVTGEGSLRLSPVAGATRVVWREELAFPWWMGGPLGEWVASLVLTAVWRRNLERLGRRVRERR